MMRVKHASPWLLIGFATISGAVLLAQQVTNRPKPAPSGQATLHIVTPSQVLWTVHRPASLAERHPSPRGALCGTRRSKVTH
jgi:hypothetical protein